MIRQGRFYRERWRKRIKRYTRFLIIRLAVVFVALKLAIPISGCLSRSVKTACGFLRPLLFLRRWEGPFDTFNSLDFERDLYECAHPQSGLQTPLLCRSSRHQTANHARGTALHPQPTETMRKTSAEWLALGAEKVHVESWRIHAILFGYSGTALPITFLILVHSHLQSAHTEYCGRAPQHAFYSQANTDS